jgi:hypothetical protein
VLIFSCFAVVCRPPVCLSTATAEPPRLFASLELSGVEWNGVEWNFRPTVIRPVCLGVGPPFGAHDQILNFLYSDIYFYVMYGALSDERVDVYLAVLTVRTKSKQNLRPNFTVSFETEFPFCRLLRLAELRWRYSNPPPHSCRRF